MRPPKPHNRAGIWYLVRRVPTRFRFFDTRTLVYISTGVRVVDDPRGIHATRVVADLNAALEQSWLDLEAGREPDAARSYERARRDATKLGLDYVQSSDLLKGPEAEVMRRATILASRGLHQDRNAIEAAFGLVGPPKLMLSDLPEAFEHEQRASLKAMSPDQLRRWRNPKKRAAQDLIDVIGDRPVADLTRANALEFRDHWKDRVIAGKAEIGTANKQFGHIGRMLRVVETAQQLGIPLETFEKLRIEGETTGQRTAFDQTFIQDAILADGALDGLNPEARRVVFVMSDTGLRVSEVVNLLPHHIHLDAGVPHVSIEPEGRKLKTDQSERKMPLVGCALEAMKRQPNGFPRYRDKGASLSALVNKYLSNHGMRPTDGHSLYSLRHSFEDRLTALDPPDKVIATLMGHKFSRPKYGAGLSLEHLQGWLKKIAFEPPARL